MKWLSYKLLVISGCVLCVVLGALGAQQRRPELDALLEKLRDESTSDDAKLALVKIGESDPEAKAYVAERLPALLESYGGRGNHREDFAWGDAAELAGEFQVAGAVPILCKRFSLRTSLASNFLDQAAGRAFIRIGQPAVPCAIDYLKNGTRVERMEAAMVLGKIGTDDAHRALQEQLGVERDPKARLLIQQWIRQTQPTRGRQ